MVAGHLQVKKDHYYIVLYVENGQGKKGPKWFPTGIRKGTARDEKKAQDMLLEMRVNYLPEPMPASKTYAALPAKSGATVQRKALSSPERMSGDMLFTAFMAKWLHLIKNHVKETTYAGYTQNVMNRIIPYFKPLDLSLSSVTALDIDDFYDYCFNELGVSGATVQRYHANIHKAFRYAIKHDLITSNPMDKIDRPKAETYVGAFLTISEVEQLFSVFRNDPLEYAVYIACFYGLRRSEVIGLKWSAVDFDSNLITINHTVTQFTIDGKTIITQQDRTKNESSRRTMPLVPQFRQLLLRLRERQDNCRKLCGNCYHHSDYIFVNDMGVPYTPNYITQHFKYIIEKKQFRPVRFHDLRHTCASLLLKNGVSMKDIQAWLGHSNFSTTANIYAHLDSDSKSLSAARMDGVMTINTNVPIVI